LAVVGRGLSNWSLARCSLVAAALALAGCGLLGRPADAERYVCNGMSTAVNAPPAGSEADFAVYGYPTVAAQQQYTPGRETRIVADRFTLILPADFYTEPLNFELLTQDEAVWQRCVSDRVVIAPYAYRATERESGKLVGRFDRPVRASISDPRISTEAHYWTTSPDPSPQLDELSDGVSVSGTTLSVPNGFARRGWLITVARR
jgi:hypothetical protein